MHTRSSFAWVASWVLTLQHAAEAPFNAAAATEDSSSQVLPAAAALAITTMHMDRSFKAVFFSLGFHPNFAGSSEESEHSTHCLCCRFRWARPLDANLKLATCFLQCTLQGRSSAHFILDRDNPVIWKNHF